MASCVNSVCGTKNEANGANSSAQTPGDCKVIICDGNGNQISMADDDPPPPKTDCFVGFCSGTVPMQAALQANQLCNSNAGKVCDGNGTCVQCNTSAQCVMGAMCVNHMCMQPQPCLYDMTKNNGETDIDCGGPNLTCARCGQGQTCLLSSDCALPLLCAANVCQ